MGSVGFVAAARAAWLVCQKPDCPDTRLLIPLKNNLSAHADGLAFQIKDGAVEWLDDVVSQSAVALLFADSTSGPKHTALDEAKSFLAAVLEEKPLPSKEVINLAEQEGMSEKSLRRAKAELEIESKRLGFANGSVSFWVLPSHTWPMDPVHGQDSRLAMYGEVGHVPVQGTDSPA
ncbi:MAG: hypothetical protein IID42_09135, partial [Planctomycetes bacterium]|nr:hypothetical protein [Planctomycetota bacterium]